MNPLLRLIKLQILENVENRLFYEAKFTSNPVRDISTIFS